MGRPKGSLNAKTVKAASGREKIPCLKCNNLFPTLDRTRNRLCKTCKAENKREYNRQTYIMKEMQK